MITKEGYMELKILHRQGVGIRKIARQTGVSRNTVRTHLRSERVTMSWPVATGSPRPLCASGANAIPPRIARIVRLRGTAP